MATAEEERVRHIEELVRRVEHFPDRESREITHKLMEAVLELHGSAIERIMDLVFESGDPGKATIRRFAADPLVASLLLLHNLHPDDLETRIQHALGKLNGSAELRGIFEGVARVRITGAGCGLKESVEAAVREAAPDLADLIIEESAPTNGFVRLDALGIAFPGSP